MRVSLNIRLFSKRRAVFGDETMPTGFGIPCLMQIPPISKFREFIFRGSVTVPRL